MFKNLIICNNQMELEVMKSNIFSLLLDGIITKKKYEDKLDRLFLKISSKSINSFRKICQH